MIETTIYYIIGALFLLWILHIIFGGNKPYTDEEWDDVMMEDYNEEKWMEYQEKCKREGREP